MHGGEDFEVERQGGREAQIAAAESQDAPRQLKCLNERADVRDHLLERCVGVLRPIDADDLHLVELVQAVEPTHILAVRTGFAAETGGVGRVADG